MGKEKQRISSEWKQRIGLYGGILLVLILASVFVRWYNFSNSVQLAAPAADYQWSSERFASSTNLPVMNDPLWKDDSIGGTGFTIGEAGSLVCALSIDAQGRMPGDINRALEAAYTDEGRVLWDKANAELRPMRYTMQEKFDPALALDSIAQGKSVLVAVADAKNNALWLYLASVSQGEYTVYNPQSGKLENLSQHGRVYMLLVGERE